MSNVALDPGLEVDRCLSRLESLQTCLKTALKQLKQLQQPGTRADLRKLAGLLKKLQALDAPIPQVAEEWRVLARLLEQWRQEQQRARPLTFGRALKQAAEQAGVGFSTVTAEPPSYRLDPLVVEADFVRGHAGLSYARLPLGRTELEPATILRERQRLVTALDGKGFDPEQFFDRLQAAYHRAGGHAGERVELVGVLPELAFLMQSSRFKSDPVQEHYRPYGKVRLAWDLARLKRHGLLSRHGRRLVLGTATIGSTRNKDGVLYLEASGGKGQYYLTIAFVEEPR